MLFTIQYKKDDGGRTVAMAMLPPPPTIPIPCPDSVILAGEEKKKSMLSHLLMGDE